MRCTYPHCYREAATRCATCRRVYCTRHCGDRVFDSGMRVPECDLCDPAPPPHPAPPPLLATMAAVGAVAVFLIVVGLGIAIDVTVRGQGFVALWVFVGAFVALVARLGH